jgi:hypothetical protein
MFPKFKKEMHKVREVELVVVRYECGVWGFGSVESTPLGDVER